MWIYEAMRGVETLERTSSMADVTGIQYDSRKIGPGDVFVAMRGGSTDGNLFVALAIEKGAAAIVTDSREVWAAGAGVPVYLVRSGRRALAAIAANLLGHPEQKLKVSAVTGTNGKTTTAYLLEQLLRAAGRKCVLIGTIETHIGDEVRPSEHTTPEASDLLQIFADGVAAGCTEAVMEMSSHALDQERVWGVHVDVAIFTNLTQDHLDYHGTMTAYAEAKAKLFRGVGTAPPRVAVLNRDDKWWGEMMQAFGRYPQVDYSLRGAGENCPICNPGSEGRTRFQMETMHGQIDGETSLVGRVNFYNLTAACLAATYRGLTVEQISAALPGLKQVPGRFEAVPNERGSKVIVDYAHTDDALRNLLVLARELADPMGGRVITLFGCGGDRDKTKRPKMGRAAGEGSDLVVLTSDNPRSEDPIGIIEEALAGVRTTATECLVEPDRAKAIALAISRARHGDIVLLAGKGHEKVQIYAHHTVPFDDVAVAASVLAQSKD